MDARHPVGLARTLAELLPRGRLAPVALSPELTTIAGFADALAPAIREFRVTDVLHGRGCARRRRR
jgi:3-oxoadipate enol-lactonase